MCSSQDITSNADCGARLQRAFVRIGGRVPRRMLNIRDRIDRLCRRLSRAGLQWDAEVMAVVEGQNNYRTWCEAPQDDLALDADRLEATATRLEDTCTGLEQRLDNLEARCTAEGH